MATTPAAIGAAERRRLREALDSAENAASTSCAFFACPGADNPFKPCATCHVCRTVQLLRRTCARLGVIAADSCACCHMHPLCHHEGPCADCGHTKQEAMASR